MAPATRPRPARREAQARVSALARERIPRTFRPERRSGPRNRVTRSDSVIRRSGDVQMNPWIALGELLQEQRRGDRSSRRPPEFLMSATSRLDQLLVVIPQRQRPSRLAGALSRARAPPAPARRRCPTRRSPCDPTQSRMRRSASRRRSRPTARIASRTPARRHKTSRPSASVLMISMNLPFDAFTTSPGFNALPTACSSSSRQTRRR